MQTLPSSLRIGVLRGGPACAGEPSPEYDTSLKSGAAILKLLSETHRPLDIFISRDGLWHMRGLPRKPEKIFPHIDIFWNALCGPYSQDRKLQKILEHHGVKYTGSKCLPSAICANRILSKEIFTKHGLKTPPYVAIKRNDDIRQKVSEIFKTFLMPVTVKPATAGSSVEVSIVGTLPEIIDAVRLAFKRSQNVLVEEFIAGREASCGVIENFRGQKYYALIPIGANRHFSAEEKKEMERLSVAAHQNLGLNHYSCSGFIVSPNRGVFILETNSLPEMTGQSILSKSLEAVGLSQKDFIHHILLLALNK